MFESVSQRCQVCLLHKSMGPVNRFVHSLYELDVSLIKGISTILLQMQTLNWSRVSTETDDNSQVHKNTSTDIQNKNKRMPMFQTCLRLIDFLFYFKSLISYATELNLYKKGMGRLYFLRKLRSFNVRNKMLEMLNQSVVASVIMYAVVCWESSLSSRKSFLSSTITLYNNSPTYER